MAPSGLLERASGSSESGSSLTAARCCSSTTAFVLLPLMLPSEDEDVLDGVRALREVFIPGSWSWYASDVDGLNRGAEKRDDVKSVDASRGEAPEWGELAGLLTCSGLTGMIEGRKRRFWLLSR